MLLLCSLQQFVCFFALQHFRGDVLISRQSLFNHAWTVFMLAVAGKWENYIVCAFDFQLWGFYCILVTYYVCIVRGGMVLIVSYATLRIFLYCYFC